VSGDPLATLHALADAMTAFADTSPAEIVARSAALFAALDVARRVHAAPRSRAERRALARTLALLGDAIAGCDLAIAETTADMGGATCPS
jgi:hypothetical protein